MLLGVGNATSLSSEWGNTVVTKFMAHLVNFSFFCTKNCVSAVIFPEGKKTRCAQLVTHPVPRSTVRSARHSKQSPHTSLYSKYLQKMNGSLARSDTIVCYDTRKKKNNDGDKAEKNR